MSHYRLYWYPVILSMLKQWQKIQADKDETGQAAIFALALEQTIKETESMIDGDIRLNIVNDVYIKKTRTIDGAAMAYHVSRRTAQRMLNRFVTTLGKNCGF